MKKNFLLIIPLLLICCNSESGSDCFKKQGDLQTEQIATEYFTKIDISTGIELVVEQSDSLSVTLEAGKNLIGDIDFEVADGELRVVNRNGCGILRNYHPARVYVKLPELVKIHSGSQYPVRSQGILGFDELLLESGVTVDGQPSALFELKIDNRKLKISDNASSVFRISGSTADLDVSFWSGSGRLEAAELITDEVHFYHRSSNDMIVFPISHASGTLAGTGNLVLKHMPGTLEVEQLYTGHVVYP